MRLEIEFPAVLIIWVATQMLVFPLAYSAWHIGWICLARRLAPALTAGSACWCLLSTVIGCMTYSGILAHLPTDGLEFFDVARVSAASAVLAWPLAYITSAAGQVSDLDDRSVCLYLGLFCLFAGVLFSIWFTCPGTYSWAIQCLVSLPFLVLLCVNLFRKGDPAKSLSAEDLVSR